MSSNKCIWGWCYMKYENKISYFDTGVVFWLLWRHLWHHNAITSLKISSILQTWYQKIFIYWYSSLSGIINHFIFWKILPSLARVKEVTNQSDIFKDTDKLSNKFMIHISLKKKTKYDPEAVLTTTNICTLVRIFKI